MTEVWRAWGDVVASVAAVPLAALVVVVLAAWRRGRGTPLVIAWRNSLAEVGAIAGTLPWIWMILTPSRHRARSTCCR